MRALFSPNPKIFGLFLALGACAGLNAILALVAPPKNKDSLGLHLEMDTAVETVSLLGLGMRRLSADLGLIRMLVYYGSPESGDQEGHYHQHDEHGHEVLDPLHPERSWGGGRYPELGPRAMRILDIDPSLSYAALYASGALAFNLNRPQEALAVLEYALKRDPKNFQYHAYIGAIGFHKNGDMASVVRILKPMLDSPDCPTMIKSMMAFLYKKLGLKEKAVRLYQDILETSRDLGYRKTAERMLQELR